MKKLVPATKLMMKCSNWDNLQKVSNAFKTHLSRNKFDLVTVLKNYNISLKTCNGCGEYNLEFYVILDNNCNPIDIKYKQNDKRPALDQNYCYGRNKKCPLKKLNPNSVEFIKKVRGLTESESLEYIHSRNSSPFYLINHDNEEDYKKSQSRIITKEYREKISRSNSKSAYIEKYGVESGLERWNKLCKSKTHTIEKFIDIYGKDEGLVRFQNFLINSPQINDLKSWTYCFGETKGKLLYAEKIMKQQNVSIQCLEDYIDYCYSFISKSELYKLESFSLENKLNESKLITSLINKYFSNIEELIKIMKESYPSIHSLSNSMKIDSNTGKYKSFFSYTFDGKLLRSQLEIDFYILLEHNNLYNNVEIDKKYSEDFLYRSDFYFSDLDIHVEISGLIGCEEYNKTIKKKEQLFNPIVLKDKSEYNKVIEYIKGLRNEN